MGFSNGNRTSKADKHKTVEKGDKGVGFSPTADNHYHIRNKRLTNVSPPINTATPQQGNSSLIY